MNNFLACTWGRCAREQRARDAQVAKCGKKEEAVPMSNANSEEATEIDHKPPSGSLSLWAHTHEA